MMLVRNRFAVLPHMCSECKRYIWLESYRRSDVWKLFAGRYVKENICKSCLKKYDIVSKEFNAVSNVNTVSEQEIEAAIKHFYELAEEGKR